MRTMYETPEDLIKERAVIDRICATAGSLIARKLPCPPYKIDWALFKGEEIYAFCEVKCRKKKYGTFLIGLHKYSSLVQLSACAGVKGIIAVEWPDGIFFIDVRKFPPIRITWLQDGRNRDESDGEPAAEFSLEDFTKLAEKSNG